MPAGGTDRRVLIIGAGRMGRGVGLALAREGVDVRLFSRTRREQVAPVARPAAWSETIGSAAAACDLVLFAVPDDAIVGLAAELAPGGILGPRHAVLHFSGLLDRTALFGLATTGAALGSFHPLQTVADPATAPERLRGAYAGIEGDPAALEAGRWLATRLGMQPVVISAAGKAAYHAGATIGANYTVALLGLAERLALAAGVTPEVASRLYLPLLRGAAANLEQLGAAQALTGPIRRGDVRTIAAHLATLDDATAELYRRLGLEALALARQAGLEESSARLVEQALTERPLPGG
jgi:predicted short-subunit dehydrogenase-like oxidoreductase (DUF2520 family)